MDGQATRNHVSVLMRILSIVIVLVALSVISRHHLRASQIVDVINDLGVLAPLGFVFLATFLRMIFMPPVLIVGVGWLMFDVVLGISSAVLGIVAGSCLAFIVGRYFIGEVGITLSEGRVRRTLEKVNEVIKRRGFLTVFALKLVFFTNAGLDYGVSRTAVTFKNYLGGAFIGLIPGAFIQLYFFEVVLRPTLVVTEGAGPSVPLESLLTESIMGSILLEQGFIWLTLHIFTRLCGVILLGILTTKNRVPHVLLS